MRALALRIVSGLTVEQIASAFLVSPAAMEQRITRAKRTIAKVGVEFETPGAAERCARLAAVSTMIYLIFNEGYGSTPDCSVAREALAGEAIRLGRLLLSLFPTDPEVFGLLALMLLQQSRAPARFDANGEIVLLDEQDRSLWNRSLIDEGRLLLERAVIYQNPGPYQLQAAIAALHARATRPADTSWKEIDSLYHRKRSANYGATLMSRGSRLSSRRRPDTFMIQTIIGNVPISSTCSQIVHSTTYSGCFAKDTGKAGNPMTRNTNTDTLNAAASLRRAKQKRSASAIGMVTRTTANAWLIHNQLKLAVFVDAISVRHHGGA
jgi:hypothetical protein